MYKNVELRKLPADALCKVVNILEINNDWMRVMSLIPKNLNSEDFEPKYNDEHLRMIKDHAKASNQKCTDILLDEWGTSGRFRPTLTTLKEILTKAQIFRAADEIARMLNESLPIRPSNCPAEPVPVLVTEVLNEESAEQRLHDMSTAVKSSTGQVCNESTRQIQSTNSKLDTSQHSEGSMNMPDFRVLLRNSDSSSLQSTHSTSESTDLDSSRSNSIQSTGNVAMHHQEIFQTSFPNINLTTGIDSVILEDTNLIHFDYGGLNHITGNFAEVLTFDESDGLKGRIGSGGFGDVFVGKHSTYGMLAVKKAHSHLAVHRRPEFATRIFNAEVKYLSQFRHSNIVPIIGFSINGPAPCIVCEYIDGGSLQQNIEAKILNELQRINIILGTAEGLKYLHTSEKLRKESLPVLDAVGESDSQNNTKHFVHGDVKTANILLTSKFIPKLCDFGLAKQYDSTFVTTCPMGTSAYMAPEGIHGTITQKVDIFSFGIVLLELLTGLMPIVSKDGEDINIKHYVEENAVNNDITPLLDSTVKVWVKADEVYKLAKMCLEYNRKSRPTIVEVCDILNRISTEEMT